MRVRSAHGRRRLLTGPGTRTAAHVEDVLDLVKEAKQSYVRRMKCVVTLTSVITPHCH